MLRLRPVAVLLARGLSRRLRCQRHHSQLTVSGRPAPLSAATCRPAWRHCSSQVLPAHHKVVLPALSPTMESGSIISWEKEQGDRISEGDLLAEVETDKATMGFESSEEGFLAKILVPAGTKDIPLGKLLCIIVDDKDDVAKFEDYVDSGTEDPTPKPAAPVPAAVVPPPPAAAPAAPTAPAAGAGVMASPRARRFAADRGVDLATVTAGSDGIVRSQHVVQSAAAAPVSSAPAVQTAPASSADHDDQELSSMRKVIAKRLVLSKQTVPHYYLTVDVNMDAVATVRQTAKRDGTKLSVNDFVIKAAALACVKVPEVNSSWMETFIRQYRTVDISVAVSTEQGLITPIVFGAEKRGVADISATVRELATRARERKLKPHEFQGGTFSISNLGMFGVSSFSAIINPPQACILAVGGSIDKLVPCSESGSRRSSVMSVTLSCDHRVVDGAVGARWLQVFKGYLEQPVTMII